MTQEGRNFFKKYWREISILLTVELLLVFVGNIGAQKVYDWRLGVVETKIDDHIKTFDEDYKPNIDILSWMHDVGKRTSEPNNTKHNHKF